MEEEIILATLEKFDFILLCILNKLVSFSGKV